MAGCYGKIPALGDFLSRNLPATFVESWDGWLRSVMAACARGGGEGWADRYLTAPTWRFVLVPKDGTAARAGVLVPSVDSIGRCFPMTVLGDLPESMTAADAMTGWDQGFERAEALILAAIGRSLEPEAFVTHLEKLAMSATPSPPAPPAPARWRREAEVGAGCRVGGVPADSASARDMLSALALGVLAAADGYSLWWRTGSELQQPATALFSGLPPPEAACGMLIGPWEDWGWSA